MDIYSLGPIAAVLDAAYHLVTFLGDVFAPVAGGASAAVAIVALTMLVRAALIPVGISQVRAEFTRRRLAPKLAALNKKHAKDRERLQRETMALYAEEKASPLAGCLPLLLQAPVLSVVYALFLRGSINGHANALLAHRLFDVPLGDSLVHVLNSGPLLPAVTVFIVLLALLTCVIAVSRRVLAAPVGTASQVASTPGPGITRALSLMPFVTVLFAAFVPLAAGLYLLTTTSWTVVERVVLRRSLAAREPVPGADAHA